MIRKFLAALSLSTAFSLGAEDIPLFDATRPLTGKLKVSHARLLQSSDTAFTLQVPAMQGWPQADILLPPLPDGRFDTLKFRAVFSTAPTDGWTVAMFHNNEKLAGGYLHQIQPDQQGFYRVDLRRINQESRFNRLQLAFKNPSKNIDAVFSDFILEKARPEPFSGLENLARGKPAIFSQAPNYPHCTNENDRLDLTDGKYAVNDNQKIWMEQESVGWRMHSTIIWSIDLGQSYPIAGVRYHTGAGTAGARWPLALYVLVSEDNRTFALAGEMIKINRPDLPEYNTGMKNLWLNMPVNANARYVRFMVKCDGMFHFADEVEIFKGRQEDCRPYTELFRFDSETTDISSSFSAYERFEADLKFLSPSNELAELRRQVAADPAKYLAVTDTVAPLNQAQVELLKINQHQLKAAGYHGVIVWTENRWNPVHIFSRPSANPTPPALKLFMLKNERRARTLNFTNAGDVPQTISLPKMQGISYYEAVCTDSSQNFLNANMLRPVTENRFTVPSGATQQIWIEFNSNSFPVGQHKFDFEIADRQIPVTVRVAAASLPEKLSSHFGTFDYINNLPSLYPGVDQNNFPAVQKIMQKYQIDTIWGSMPVIPAVDERNFSSDDTLTSEPDYTSFDQWCERFADARRLMLFYHPGQSGKFAGIDYDRNPERYRKRISQWLKAWNNHIRRKNPVPQVFLHVIDEADTPRSKALFEAWSSAAQAATADGKPFPLYFNPRLQITQQQKYKGANILISSFNYTPDVLRFYLETANKRPADLSFGFYQCNGNSRSFDPYTYYAMPVLSGMLIDNFYGFDLWDFVSAPRDLNEYNHRGMIFSPFYFNADTVYGSKQVEAVYNARQDYEYYRILLQKLEKHHPLLAELRKDLFDEITSQKENVDQWTIDRDRSRADQRQEKMWHAIKGFEQ